MDDSGFDSDHKQRQSQEDDRLFAVSDEIFSVYKIEILLTTCV